MVQSTWSHFRAKNSPALDIHWLGELWHKIDRMDELCGGREPEILFCVRLCYVVVIFEVPSAMG
jgi:hypothetical protein